MPSILLIATEAWPSNSGWVKDVKDITMFVEQAVYGFDDVKSQTTAVAWQPGFDPR